jgi:c-di-AMP phosphodiesterase-like protein
MRKRKDDEFYLYFIVRSILMGLLGASIFSVIISLLNTSQLPYVLSISAGSFFIVMFITRVFDKQIRRLVEKTLEQLEKWPGAKKFLLKHF